MSGPMPAEWGTYQLLKLGLQPNVADEMPYERVRELLDIDAAYKQAEANVSRRS